ncbi:alpha/beta hydrolase [Larkinella insperata]|uniref:Alpha/beta hydrolase n=1 Tax=Larkinella insperata TaxID=332158 RepID=A0ABW3QBZ3_9BACT|nr:alpha/beta hydrolase-fold protein [Larkinella insperata]
MFPIRLELTTPDDDRPVFVSGSFCQWQPDAEQFKLHKTAPGQYSIELPGELAVEEPPEYKYTRGGWDSVELSAAGESVPNRVFQSPSGVQQDSVPHWRWNGLPFNPDFLPRTDLVSHAFSLPQLDTTRRVQVLLPYDYEATQNRYPVLYLNDGQNLFGEGSPFGNWNIDQKLAVLAHRQHHRILVVSIDHGEEERIAEYLPYNSELAQGRGRAYLDFVVHTLKPHIDATYRTRPERTATGMGGSSMGGLISVYAGLLHPTVFGQLMVFSPALWTTPKVYADSLRFYAPEPTRVYLYGGEQESRFMVPAMERLQKSLLRRKGHETLEIELSIDPDGEHNESRWSREFPRAVEWLFF